MPLAFISVRCPHCHSDQIVKRGKTGYGTQRYLCQNATCATGSFLLDYQKGFGVALAPGAQHIVTDKLA